MSSPRAYYEVHDLALNFTCVTVDVGECIYIYIYIYIYIITSVQIVKFCRNMCIEWGLQCLVSRIVGLASLNYVLKLFVFKYCMFKMCDTVIKYVTTTIPSKTTR
jgi:hypothetical protein